MNASLATAALAFVAIAVPTSASAAAGAPHGQLPRSARRRVSFTPPRAGQLANDPADCDHTGQFNGPRKFAFEEPYKDRRARGTSTPAIPMWTATATGAGTATCSAAAPTRHASTTTSPTRSARGRWSSPTASGRSPWRCSTTRARSTSTCSASGARSHADGVHLDGIYISSNHDESAPDTIGISGVNAADARASTPTSRLHGPAVREGDRETRWRASEAPRSATRRRRSRRTCASAGRRIPSSTTS